MVSRLRRSDVNLWTVASLTGAYPRGCLSARLAHRDVGPQRCQCERRRFKVSGDYSRHRYTSTPHSPPPSTSTAVPRLLLQIDAKITLPLARSALVTQETLT